MTIPKDRAMSDDAELALGPLEARAEALGVAPPDRLSLRDHVVLADIGAFQEERGLRQRLRFNIVVEIAPVDTGDDDVDRILSYDKISDAIMAELAQERLALLETLAERVAARILREPQALRVFLRVEKLDRGPGALGVEVVRRRGAAESGAGASDSPAPVVHLLDRPGTDRSAPAGPAVLVAASAGAAPDAPTELARRQVALLALDQAAWIEGAVRALPVVATRTELDWSLRQGRTVVWAPARMARDLAGAPDRADPAALAGWLAGVVGARALVLHGTVAAPADCRVPVTRA